MAWKGLKKGFILLLCLSHNYAIKYTEEHSPLQYNKYVMTEISISANALD